MGYVIQVCYVNNLDFVADDDVAAIALCEKLQEEHDAKAFELAEADRSLRLSYENAPLAPMPAENRILSQKDMSRSA